MSKSSSAKCYQENKEILQKNLVKDINVFLKRRRKKATIWSRMIKKSPKIWKR